MCYNMFYDFITMPISKNDCPIPFDQQPINEYLSLKRSYLFSLSLADTYIFMSGFSIIFICIVMFVTFVLGLLYYKLSLLKLFCLSFSVSNIFFIFIFLRIYLGWSYVLKRLLSATVFYEESGWYDGQVWVKTADYLTQDRLVGFYQIMPSLIRIKYVCFILILSFLFFLSCYRLL